MTSVGLEAGQDPVCAVNRVFWLQGRSWVGVGLLLGTVFVEGRNCSSPLVSLSVLTVEWLFSWTMVNACSAWYSEAKVAAAVFSQVRASRTEGYAGCCLPQVEEKL